MVIHMVKYLMSIFYPIYLSYISFKKSESIQHVEQESHCYHTSTISIKVGHLTISKLLHYRSLHIKNVYESMEAPFI